MAIFRKHLLPALGAFALAFLPASGMEVLNPYFTVKDILPAGMENIPGIGGIGLLPNGDGAVCAWGGSQKSLGEIWIVPALATGNPGIPARIATGLREPLGVAVVGEDFYVMEKPRILKFTRSGGSWTSATAFTLGSDWYRDQQWHHFSYNLVYHDDAFWFVTGTAYPFDTFDPLERGALIRVPLDGSGYRVMARGMNAANGLGVGPQGELFMTENQGHWKPANALYRIPVKGDLPANGRFYGFRRTTNNACGVQPPALDGSGCAQDPEYPPAIWLPYASFSNSPSRPILLQAGPYAGQMISGDIFYGGVLRYQVEKVNGEWQGAAFTFQAAGAAGVGFGIHQFLYTPSGNMLVAGIGGGTGGLGGDVDWNWKGTVRGLALLTPTATPVFDMLAIRSLKDGFDIEFSQPVSAAAGEDTNWSVKTTVYSPIQAHGGDGSRTDNNVTVQVASATLSDDGRHVHLKLASLLTRRMYAIKVNGVSSAGAGQALYTNVGYYTLNSVSPDSGFATRVGSPTGRFPHGLRFSQSRGRVAFEMTLQGPWNIDLVRLDGIRIAHAQGSGPGRFESPCPPRGLYLAVGRVGGELFREKVMVR